MAQSLRKICHCCFGEESDEEPLLSTPAESVQGSIASIVPSKASDSEEIPEDDEEPHDELRAVDLARLEIESRLIRMHHDPPPVGVFKQEREMYQQKLQDFAVPYTALPEVVQRKLAADNVPRLQTPSINWRENSLSNVTYNDSTFEIQQDVQQLLQILN